MRRLKLRKITSNYYATLPHSSSLISDPVRGQIKRRSEELKTLLECKMVIIQGGRTDVSLWCNNFWEVESGSLNHTWWVSINLCLVSTGSKIRWAHFHYVETLFTTRKTSGILKLISLWFITPCLSEAYLKMRDRIDSSASNDKLPKEDIRKEGRIYCYLGMQVCVPEKIKTFKDISVRVLGCE